MKFFRQKANNTRGNLGTSELKDSNNNDKCLINLIAYIFLIKKKNLIAESKVKTLSERCSVYKDVHMTTTN